MSTWEAIVLERPGAGLALIRYNGDTALWARCRMRKRHECAITGLGIPAGFEAYRPLINRHYRWRRISIAAVEGIPTPTLLEGAAR